MGNEDAATRWTLSCEWQAPPTPKGSAPHWLLQPRTHGTSPGALRNTKTHTRSHLLYTTALVCKILGYVVCSLHVLLHSRPPLDYLWCPVQCTWLTKNMTSYLILGDFGRGRELTSKSYHWSAWSLEHCRLSLFDVFVNAIIILIEYGCIG